jgi:hypothetical protein
MDNIWNLVELYMGPGYALDGVISLKLINENRKSASKQSTVKIGELCILCGRFAVSPEDPQVDGLRVDLERTQAYSRTFFVRKGPYGILCCIIVQLD